MKTFSLKSMPFCNDLYISTCIKLYIIINYRYNTIFIENLLVIILLCLI